MKLWSMLIVALLPFATCSGSGHHKKPSLTLPPIHGGQETPPGNIPSVIVPPITPPGGEIPPTEGEPPVVTPPVVVPPLVVAEPETIGLLLTGLGMLGLTIALRRQR